MHVPPPEQTDDQSPNGIHDEIPHFVGQCRGITEHRLLHVHAEELIHRELEYLPDCAHCDGKQKGEQRHEPWPHLQVDSVAGVQHVNQQASENTWQKPREGVQRDVPPPEAVILTSDFPEKDRCEDNSHRRYLVFGRNLQSDAAGECRGQKHHENDGQRQRRSQPLTFVDREHQTDTHHHLQATEHPPSDSLGAVGWVRKMVGWLSHTVAREYVSPSREVACRARVRRDDDTSRSDSTLPITSKA